MTEIPAPPPSLPLSFERGRSVIEEQLKTLPSAPGVYRMLSERGDVLYVGKAKNLKKRVVAYTRFDTMPGRLQRMVAQTASMEIVTTHTEVEALLLESNLIKRLTPRYNILLRDDKSFPYILLTDDHDWPQLIKHRGARTRSGQYFGPFASATAVNHTLSFLQRAFLLRTCSDAVFASRTRPCLLHQIKRCSGPCANKIAHADYMLLVDEIRAFLSGKSRVISQDLSARMQQASEELNFEEAALYRDRIRALSHILARQDINLPALEDADVIALSQAGGQSCIQVFFFRSGCNYGNRAYFPAQTTAESDSEILEAFVGQFYDDRPPPQLVLLSAPLPQSALMAEALTLKAGHKVVLQVPQRGDKRKLMDHAALNAREALGRRLAENTAHRQMLEETATLFSLSAPPARIEVYDNSHIQGTHAVGGMVVFGPDGFMKNAYRKFNIRGEDLTPGDDFGMMREVMTRRFSRALREDPDRESGQWPDLLLIDGGEGQLSSVQETLADLGLTDLAVVAISKGPDRNAGREQFHQTGRPTFSLEPKSPVLYFLQRLRDEVHRFAIGTHRARRSKAISQSLLDEIPGIGAQRKKALLHHFGSARHVAQAGLSDLEAVDGISQAIAKKIYDHFHTEN